MTITCLFALLVDTYPQIAFENRPSYLPSNVLALTFDDGPDSVDAMNMANSDNTRKVLDVLRGKGVHATFFINTNNYTDVTMDDQAKSYLRRMLAEGHEIGNHTVHHAHLGAISLPMDPGAPTAADIEAEIAGVGAVLRTPSVLGNCAPRLSLFRAPYGEPYQPPNDTTPRYQLVAPIVARHAVEIGWAIDTFDYNCTFDANGPGDPDCVYNNFVSAVATPGNGNYGIVLMHAVQPQTATALPRILDYIEQHGFVLKSVEDVVRAKFGMSSGELVPDDGSGGPGGNCGQAGSGGAGGTGGAGGSPGVGDGGESSGVGGAGGSGGGTNGVFPSGGCGCVLAGGDTGGGATLLALVVGLVLVRRATTRL